jgi:superfamily I DNA/RNA helicase
MKEAEKAVNVGQTVAILIPNGLAAITFVNEVLKEKGKPQWNESKNQWGKPDFGNLNQHLQSHSVKLQYVGNGYGSFDNEDKICVMTYHSSKGLDFDNVFLPNLNKQLVVYKDEKLSKTLFMVAMTRSRNNLYLTYSGEMSDYLQSFSDDCNKIDIHSALLGKSSFGNSTNIFGF